MPFVAEALWQRRYRLALLLLFIAGVTDGIDGWIARRFGWLTRFGAVLDPIADKALLITLYVVLAFTSVVPLWLTALVLARDIFILSMVAAGLAFTTVRDFPPSLAGKISTIVQISAALALVGNAAAGSIAPGWMVPTIIAAVAVATAGSGFDYGRRGFVQLRRLRIDAGDSRR